MWANIPINEVKADWEAALSRNNITLRVCFMAMDRLVADGVKFPPSQPEFLKLCKSIAPVREFNQITKKPDKEAQQAGRKKLQDFINQNFKIKRMP